MLPFFVYGTLRPGHANHDRYLAGRCAAIRPAVLAGVALYAGPGYPYVRAAPGRQVHGELITVDPALYPSLLAQLDELEDCRPDGSGEYVRLRMEATAEDGTPTQAWVYLAGRRAEPRLGALIASGDWTHRR